MAQFQLGSISTGTLRTEDLLETFARVLESHNNEGNIRDICLTLDNPLHALFGEYLDIELNNAWESEEAYSLLHEGFYYALNDICPPFVYFGAHPGDGADYGFWPDTESLGDALQDAADSSEAWDWSLGDYILADDGVIVQVSDHGNVTVMDMERNVLWTTT
jgi:hypothetical protein